MEDSALEVSGALPVFIMCACSLFACTCHVVQGEDVRC
jgi:hypothetical protein